MISIFHQSRDFEIGSWTPLLFDNQAKNIADVVNKIEEEDQEKEKKRGKKKKKKKSKKPPNKTSSNSK